MKKIKDVFVCAQCGSRHIERCYWMRVNTGEIMRGSKAFPKAWCPNCSQPVETTTEDKFHGRKQ